MGRVADVTLKPRGAATALPVVSNVGYKALGPVNALTFGNGIQESRIFDLDYRLHLRRSRQSLDRAGGRDHFQVQLCAAEQSANSNLKWRLNADSNRLVKGHRDHLNIGLPVRPSRPPTGREQRHRCRPVDYLYLDDRPIGTFQPSSVQMAKGREWRATFMIGLEEGLVPHYRALVQAQERPDGDALEDELRGFYVGITRARERLFLSVCLQPSRGEQAEPRQASRRLHALPPNLLVAV
jgi:hypothetical protein